MHTAFDRRGRVCEMVAMGVRALCAAFFVGCGARTELIAPDVAMEADVAADTPEERTDDVADVTVGLPPIDPTCPGTCPFGTVASQFPPFERLVPPGLPASCSNGFQLGGVSGGCGGATYTLQTNRTDGANAVTLAVDFATYLVPDGVIVTGVDATGATYTLMESCRLQTSLVGGPSNMRPPDDTIRQFRLQVRAGTTRLSFDFGSVTSPMYMQVLGLCDFTVTRFAQASWWEPVP